MVAQDTARTLAILSMAASLSTFLMGQASQPGNVGANLPNDDAAKSIKQLSFQDCAKICRRHLASERLNSEEKSTLRACNVLAPCSVERRPMEVYRAPPDYPFLGGDQPLKLGVGRRPSDPLAGGV